MSPPVKQCTFAGGEITPTAFARSDLALYEKSARTLRNMICMKHGGVGGRPGTMYVGTTLNGGNPVRLIPFIFNETGLGQSYVLEFGNQYIAFYQNGGVVVSAPNTPYTIASPYLQADLALLNFQQNADVLTIVHQNYQVRELRRSAPTSWALVGISNWGSNVRVPTIAISGTAGGGITEAYVVTSVDVQGQESDPLSPNWPNNFGNTAGFTAPTPTTPIRITWSAVTGAVSYRVYASQQTGNTYGFIGQTSDVSFTDPGLIPDYTNLFPQYTQFFGNDGDSNNPAVVGFSQQRRYFANTKNNPIGFWGSQPGLYSNFDVHITSQDDDAVVGSLAGEEVNQIQAITELKFMLMLTAGAEIYVQGNGAGVVTPSAVNASVQSQYGCAPLRPLKCADILIFNQALGSFIRDFAFDFAIDGYRGNDISIFASHLFEGYQIVDWCYQKVPDSIIWAVRSDGKLLSCTYIREQQVLAWTHHDLTSGFVENVCAIPENGEYAVYASIKRTMLAPITNNQYVIVSGVNDAIDFKLATNGSIWVVYIAPGTYNSTTLSAAIAAAFNGPVYGFAVVWQCAFTAGHVEIWQVDNGHTTNYSLLWGSGANSATNAATILGWPKIDSGLMQSRSAYGHLAPNLPASIQTLRYIERLSSRIWQGPAAAVAAGTANALNDPINAPFSDCSAQFDGRNTGSVQMSLNAPIQIQIGVNDRIQWQDSSNAFAVPFSATISPTGEFSPPDLAQRVQTAMDLVVSGYSISLVGNKITISHATYTFGLIYGTNTILPTLGFTTGSGTGTSVHSHSAPGYPTSNSFSTDGTAYQQLLYLESTTNIIGSYSVGDQIFLEDELWVSSQGQKGNQIRLTIQRIDTPTFNQALVTPSGIVPSVFQSIPTTIWAHAVQTVSGLSFLAGSQVSVWADRFVVGSPLNPHYSTIYTVPFSGILTLDKPYSVIYVGLPIIQDVETLDLETYFGETMMGRRKRTAGLYGYIYQTRSFYAGSENPDTNNQNSSGDPLFQLFALRTGINQKTYDQPPPLLTSQEYQITTARWNKRGAIFMRNLDPVPWTLLAVAPKEEDPVQGTYKRA